MSKTNVVSRWRRDECEDVSEWIWMRLKFSGLKRKKFFFSGCWVWVNVMYVIYRQTFLCFCCLTNNSFRSHLPLASFEFSHPEKKEHFSSWWRKRHTAERMWMKIILKKSILYSLTYILNEAWGFSPHKRQKKREKIIHKLDTQSEHERGKIKKTRSETLRGRNRKLLSIRWMKIHSLRLSDTRATDQLCCWYSN